MNELLQGAWLCLIGWMSLSVVIVTFSVCLISGKISTGRGVGYLLGWFLFALSVAVFYFNIEAKNGAMDEICIASRIANGGDYTIEQVIVGEKHSRIVVGDDRHSAVFVVDSTKRVPMRGAKLDRSMCDKLCKKP